MGEMTLLPEAIDAFTSHKEVLYFSQVSTSNDRRTRSERNKDMTTNEHSPQSQSSNSSAVGLFFALFSIWMSNVGHGQRP